MEFDPEDPTEEPLPEPDPDPQTADGLLHALSQDWLGGPYPEWQKAQDFRAVFFADRRARKVLFYLLTMSGIFQRINARQGADPALAMAHLEGRREFGYELLRLLYGRVDVPPPPLKP